MGRGGDSGIRAARPVNKRVPVEKPPFTIGDLKRAIPPHCFKRSLALSFAYLLWDLTILGTCFALSRYFEHPSIPAAVTWLALWPLYWIVTGCVATGVWVIAHECGHQAFSDYGWVNDLVGWAFHSMLLVPYFSWKYSHRRHHSNTGSMEKDEVFVPATKEEVSWTTELIMSNPGGRLVYLVLQLVIGWPWYLAFNVTGRKYPRWANHFDPSSPIFNKRERLMVFVSDVGLLAAFFGLYKLSATYGFLHMVKVYGVPLLIVNAWLVLITFLQHTHPALPHYNGSEWDWLRGALATVDRNYGILNHVFHRITDTHVVHHLFSTMPHYHAEEATKAVKPILGPYYQYDPTPLLKATWREFSECFYVEPDQPGQGVFWFKSTRKQH